jgi:hypothetical protein
MIVNYDRKNFTVQATDYYCDKAPPTQIIILISFVNTSKEVLLRGKARYS